MSINISIRAGAIMTLDGKVRPNQNVLSSFLKDNACIDHNSICEMLGYMLDMGEERVVALPLGVLLADGFEFWVNSGILRNKILVVMDYESNNSKIVGSWARDVAKGCAALRIYSIKQEDVQNPDKMFKSIAALAGYSDIFVYGITAGSGVDMLFRCSYLNEFNFVVLPYISGDNWVPSVFSGSTIKQSKSEGSFPVLSLSSYTAMKSLFYCSYKIEHIQQKVKLTEPEQNKNNSVAGIFGNVVNKDRHFLGKAQ